MPKTTKSIRETLNYSVCSLDTASEFFYRISLGNPTRDENKESHFCVYFLPYNPKTKQIFIVHHKKSGLWLSPGGHIDKEETVTEAVFREVHEELGFMLSKIPKLFLLTITPINNPNHPCKKHFDIWFCIETDGHEFNINSQEFHETKWVTVKEARDFITDHPNIKALDKMTQILYH